MAERIFDVDTWVSRSVTYAIRSPRSDTAGLLDEVRRAIWSVDPNLPLVDVQTTADLVRTSIAPVSFALVLLSIAGAVALVLGVVGVYGLINYAVSLREHEIGIRVALGAPGWSLRRAFLRQGMLLAGIGAVFGLALAIGATRLMGVLLFGVTPLDLVAFAAAGIVLVAATGLASFLPANRAARVDPLEALRSE